MRTGFFLAALLPALLAGGTFRIEAEKLDGGWTLRKTSAAVGKALVSVVKKGSALSGKVILPEPGRYTVWARTFDFGEKYRRTTLFFNGKEIGTVGDDSPRAAKAKPVFCWHKAGAPVELAAGPLTVRAVSAGGYARLDAVILSSDENFVPPEDPREAEKTKELLPEAEKKVMKLPAPKGKGPHVLLLSGGRPWTGEEAAALLVKAGCKVTLLDSTYLDGFGGASTKKFFSDLVEPPKMDGITPAFRDLSRYRLVVFNAIPAKLLDKLLSQERIALLRAYVENGGSVLFNRNAPQTLGDLLPVIPGGLKKMDPSLVVGRPEGKVFSVLPENWCSNAACREAKPGPGAEVPAWMSDKDGNRTDVFLARRKLGKGAAWFWNADWVRLSGTRQLYNWAYGKALWIGVVAAALDAPLSTKGAVFSPQPEIPHKDLGTVTVKVTEPVLELVPVTREPRIEGDRITFANGTHLAAAKDGSVAIRYPGCSREFVRRMTPPLPVWSLSAAKLTDPSSEAIEADRTFTAKGVRWRFDGIRQCGGGEVSLEFSTPRGYRMAWRFRAGDLDLDGRKFSGISEAVAVTAAPDKLERVLSVAEFSPGDHTVRRMACYAQKNRGYMEYDFSGKCDNDSEVWQFFTGGIPFTYVRSNEGVFTEFVDSPVPTHVRFDIKAGSRMRRTMTRQCGFRPAPVEFPAVWHMFSPGPERGNDDYLALHQFQRKHLREKTGIKSFAHTTKAIYTNMASPDEIRKSMKYASGNGFKVMRHPWCPSPVESLDSPERVKMLRLTASYGLVSRPWTAGDYTHGDGTWIFKTHPEWFVRRRDGKIFQYFNAHPVLDLNNEAYRQWYFALMKRAMANGLGEIYLDMFGASSQNVNFSDPDARPGLSGGIKIVKFFSDNGIPVGAEGMNPLTQDNWWYRPNLYRNFAGQEFAANGSSICGTPESSFALNFFRAAMYNICVSFDVEGPAMGFDRIPGETKKMTEALKLVRTLNEVYKKVGYPVIRETPMGTLWMGKDHGALFCYDSVKELRLDLPPGWRAQGQLKNIGRESVIFIKKEK